MYANNTSSARKIQLAPLIASLPCKNQRPSIDRLVILGDFKNIEKNTLALSHHNDYCDVVNAAHPYHYRIRTASDLHIQVADKTSHVQNVRIEWNPNKLTSPQDTLLPLLLPMLKHKRYSRIDYAIDYAEDLSQWSFTTTRPRKRVKFISPADKLETLYLGVRTSADFYRIYDKAKEQEMVDDVNLWRIEQQFNLDKDTEYWMLRPFADLVAWKPSDMTGKYIDDLVLADLHANPENWSRLSDFLRRKYRTLAQNANHASQMQIHPSEAFLAGYQPLADFLGQLLK